MRVLTLCLGIGIMLAAACSSSSKDDGGAGGSGAGGSGAGGSGAGGSGGGSIPLTGACANLTCLNPMMNLLSSCQSGGTCTTSSSVTATAMVSSTCYTNGVKQQTSMNMSSATSPIIITVKNGSSVCYSMEVSGMSLTGGSTGAMTVAIKNGSGTLVGTIGVDSSSATASETVTCPGGAATVIDASCGSGPASAQPSVPSSTDCTPGTCTF